MLLRVPYKSELENVVRGTKISILNSSPTNMRSHQCNTIQNGAYRVLETRSSHTNFLTAPPVRNTDTSDHSKREGEEQYNKYGGKATGRPA